MRLMNLPAELLLHISSYVEFEQDLKSLRLTCKGNGAIAGRVMWREIKACLSGEGLKKFIEVLEGSEECAGWIGKLYLVQLDPGSVPETAPRSELCARFAKVLRKMSGLRYLNLPSILCK